MTQVLLLGTFHFMESGIDFYTDEAQKQLQKINEQLAKFNPDAIAVEAAVHAQESVDNCYHKFSLDDLSNCEKMRNETLGTIFVFGGTHPVPYNSEAIQVGYRLGRTLRINKIHAIDDDTALGDINEKIPKRIQQTFDKHFGKMEMGNGTILDMYRNINSDEWSYHNQQLFLVKNQIGAGMSYAGADYFGRWYMRNLKIFANLQKLCDNYKRIFVLYGAGHLYILRELIKLCENMELVNYRDFL